MNQRETIDGVPGEWRTVDGNMEVKTKEHYRLALNGDIQRFFPLADKPKRKVAKVTVKKMAYYRVWFKLDRMCKFTPEFAYSSRKSAIRGARRFCKAIGYDMEVVK